MFVRDRYVLFIVSTLLLAGSHAYAQRAGQSVTVRAGTVTAEKTVDLNDGNALGGALVGGAVGAALTRSSKSTGRRDRNAAIGAVLGGAAAASKTKPGRIYTVTMIDGAIMQIATEQTEIRLDDCVFVEQTGAGANIRRAPAAACSPATQEVLKDPAVAEELSQDAASCAAAKQELIAAETDAAVDRAFRKVELLCYD
jgi:outer membrane lipoprotein SlyB